MYSLPRIQDQAFLASLLGNVRVAAPLDRSLRRGTAIVNSRTWFRQLPLGPKGKTLGDADLGKEVSGRMG